MALQWVLHLTQLISITNKESGQAKMGARRAQHNPPNYRFHMPLHYPRYTKSDYQKMDEWKLDALLNQYGFDTCHTGETLCDKRTYAIGAFLWPHQL